MPTTGTLAETSGTLPLVLVPDGAADRAADAVVEYLRDPAARVEERLATHGAILLRGFELADPAAFERVARVVDSELKNNYLGTSPRDALTPYVFSASELPGYYPIPQHCEMSFLRRPPRRLFFCCLLPNGGDGGETPLCDFRSVARDLDPAVLERFERRGVRIIRNYCGPSQGAGSTCGSSSAGTRCSRPPTAPPSRRPAATTDSRPAGTAAIDCDWSIRSLP